MPEYDTVPQEADDRQDAISSSKDESSGVDLPPVLLDCLDVGCTWPCAHHIHRLKDPPNLFRWCPDLDHFGYYQNPEIPRIQSEMKVGTKDCQFCGIFFSIIGKSDCACGVNGRNDHILESGGCRFTDATCSFRSNGQVSRVQIGWKCRYAIFELGLPTGKLVWSLYDLSNECFLTLASSRQCPQFPTHSAMHGHLAFEPGIG